MALALWLAACQTQEMAAKDDPLATALQGTANNGGSGDSTSSDLSNVGASHSHSGHR